MALILKHQTKAQFAARLRERYRNASKEEAARIATRLLAWIEAGDVTDTQVRNVFGLTVNQWSTLKAKLIALRDNYLAMLTAEGE